jgi:metal-responsive CopG/Arc/MetJ family transcriptional regulator
MNSSVSIYLPDNLLKWLNEEDKKIRRSRSETIRLFLEDIRDGKFVRKEESEEVKPVDAKA